MITHSDLIYAQKLKVLIQKNNLVQKQVADKTGIHQQVISELIRGNKPFTSQIIQSINHAFSVDLETLDTPSPDFFNEKTIIKIKEESGLSSNNIFVNELVKSKEETIKVIEQIISSKDETIKVMQEKENLYLEQIKDLERKVNLLKSKLDNKT
jgi:transcriptional regulator with XRE-family HTH domain